MCRLQHTDVDVPHFTDDDHNFVKGAFHTIDRPYDKLDPYVPKIVAYDNLVFSCCLFCLTMYSLWLKHTI